MLQIQHSFQKGDQPASLYLISTPIGNLEDITYRSVKMLQEAALIAAEDTRQSKKLLQHYAIKTPLISYHEHNKQSAGQQILQALQSGQNVALVSDAGTPAISDPGYEIVRAAIEEGFAVIPVPGANAGLAGLVISGLPTEHFYFAGFLPRDKKRCKDRLAWLKKLPDTVIIYEAPHRLLRTLTLLCDVCGNRRLAIARELTKAYEEVVRGSCEECLGYFNKMQPKGEFCIVMEGGLDEQEDVSWWRLLSLEQHVEYYTEKGWPKKEAMRKTAQDRQVSKRDVYQQLHAKKDPAHPDEGKQAGTKEI